MASLAKHQSARAPQNEQRQQAMTVRVEMAMAMATRAPSPQTHYKSKPAQRRCTPRPSISGAETQTQMNQTDGAIRRPRKTEYSAARPKAPSGNGP